MDDRAFAKLMRAKVTAPPPAKPKVVRGRQNLELAGTKHGDRKPSTVKQTAPGGCVHHWVIEEPNGESTHHGTCKRCGKGKDFLAALPDDYDFRDADGNARRVIRR